MSTPKDGGPAFPSTDVHGFTEFGMTMRQRYKVALATSMITGSANYSTFAGDLERERCATNIGMMADALLAEDAEHERKEES